MELRFECDQTWDGLQGTDKIERHCDSCDKSVFNLSGMTRKEAKRLIESSGKELPCVHFLSRNGRIIHNGDPYEQLQAQRYGAGKLVAGAIAIQATLMAVGLPNFMTPIELLFGTCNVAEPQRLTGVMIDDDIDRRFIEWERGDIDCVGRANCEDEAINSYWVGKRLADRSDADIANPYEAYKQLDRAMVLLERGGIDEIPDEMADAQTLMVAIKAKLDTKFKQHRLEHRNFKTRKMYVRMAEGLRELQVLFPDKRCQYNQWAVEQERMMKDDGLYPW